MIQIPPNILKRFVAYLNDYILERSEWKTIFEGRSPNHVGIEDVNGINYTVIRFIDGTWAIVPNVYTEFLDAMKNTDDAKHPV